jgi:hypothetical protein
MLNVFSENFIYVTLLTLGCLAQWIAAQAQHHDKARDGRLLSTRMKCQLRMVIRDRPGIVLRSSSNRLGYMGCHSAALKYDSLLGIIP